MDFRQTRVNKQQSSTCF